MIVIMNKYVYVCIYIFFYKLTRNLGLASCGKCKKQEKIKGRNFVLGYE